MNSMLDGMDLLRSVGATVYRLAQRVFPHSMAAKPFHYAMLSHPGRVRKGNEDTCAAMAEIGAFVVCDGMGGAAAGEVASRMASEAFLRALMPEKERARRMATPDFRLDKAIHLANDAVYRHSRRSSELRGMGTTLVSLLVEPALKGPPSLTLAHVGDSRCYRFRDGQLTQLTEDHSLVEEQVRSGEITAAEAEVHPMRNIITRAVGSQGEVEPEIRHVESKAGDIYLLASDGLTRELTDWEIGQTLHRAVTREKIRSRPEEVFLTSVCQTLVDEANDAGGGDNITVLLVKLG